MISSTSVAAEFTVEQRKGICKWCIKRGKAKCATCAINKTEPYKEKR